MEGIVRQVPRYNPNMDIVITHFVNPRCWTPIGREKSTVSIAAHETVAERNGVSSIHLAREVVRQIDTSLLTWQKYGGAHPAPLGNGLCERMIDTLLGRAWSAPAAADAQPRTYPLLAA